MLSTRTKSLLAGISVVMLTMGSYDSNAAPQKSLKPILPLSTKISAAPLLDHALQDPSVSDNVPSRHIEAERLVIELKQHQNDLKRAKGMRYRDLTEQLFEGYLLLSYHMSNVASGITQSDDQLHTVRKNLAAVRGVLINYAKQHASFQKTGAKKDRALFHLYVTRYQLNYKRATSVANISKLRYLPGTLKRRGQLLEATLLSESSSKNSLDRANKKLQSLAKTLTRSGGIYARLTAARAAAGLNPWGKKVAKSNKQYRSLLINATKSASRFDDHLHNQVLARAVAIWRRAESSNSSYARPPVYLKGSEHLLVSRAIQERRALEAFTKGQYNTAASGYSTLSDAYQKQSLAWSMDQRLITIRATQYGKSSQSKRYENTLIDLQKRYENSSYLGEGNQNITSQAHASITKKYEVLVSTELTATRSASAKKWRRNQAIAMGERFILLQPDGTAKEKIQYNLAKSHSANRNHKRAVELYMDLTDGSTGSTAKNYLRLAIQEQRQLAKWSSKVTWAKRSQERQSERQYLADMYEKMAEKESNKVNWQDSAQHGLLLVNIEQKDAAFKLWTSDIQKDSKHAYAATTAAIMMKDYSSANEWENLEAISRIALNKNISPKHGKERFSPHKTLGVALLNGGQEAMQQASYAHAVLKLKEFTDKYGSHGKHDDALFMLARAHKGAGQHVEALEIAINHVNKYPRSRNRQAALIAGGRWAQDSADEENAIYLQSRYLKEFRTSKEASSIAEQLMSLYLGKGMYAQAIALLQQRSALLKGEQKTEALAEIMDLEFRYGSEQKALKLARSIESTASRDSDAYVQALLTRARAAIEEEDTKNLQRFESRLANVSSDNLNVTEGLGEIRFALANFRSKNAIRDVYNLELANPLQTINELHDQFEIAAKTYDQVCQIPSSFCPAANYSIARMAEQLAKSLESITINQTLPEDEVNVFENKKRSLLDSILTLAKAKDEQALADVRNGNSQPDWTMQVLWHNTSDWNFDRITGEMGNAYIQHEPVGHQTVNYIGE